VVGGNDLFADSGSGADCCLATLQLVGNVKLRDAEIRSGDLLAFGHEEWGSYYDVEVQLVRMTTRSEYAHVATAFVSGGMAWVLEAVRPAPRAVPLANLLPFYWIPLNAPWRPATQAWALSMLGKKGEKYSKIEAIKGAFLDVEPGKDNNWQCAEWSWVIANMDNIDLGQEITPSGLVEAAHRIAPSYYIEA
jgi:hypothetical protein